MTSADAEAVCRFVDEHDPYVGAVVVHCEQGMSRSPAVAAALALAYGGDFRRFFRNYQPNRWVYSLLDRKRRNDMNCSPGQCGRGPIPAPAAADR
jgi:predicted protein tyrosine phosphatase